MNAPSIHRRFRAVTPPSHGFSLVEVVLAVGVVSFAFVAILGLIPAGLTQFRQAIDTSVCSQIAQRVFLDAEQTDYLTLTALATRDTNGGLTQNQAIDLPLRYFDEQGNEVVGVTGQANLSLKNVIYHANTRIVVTTAMPDEAYSEQDSQSIVTITVEVAFNPSNKTLPIDTSSAVDQDKVTRYLFDRTKKEMTGVSVKTYAAQIGRNQ